MGRRSGRRKTKDTRRGFLLGLSALAALIVVAVVVSRPGPGRRLFRVVSPDHEGPGQVERANLAPDFEVVMYQGAELVGGNRIRLSRLWGAGRPVVLNFWAGLCPPCRAEMPDFQRVFVQRGTKDFLLIGVDIGPFIRLGSREDGKALLRELGITFPAGTTFDADAVVDYQILGMPTTVFITGEGRIWRKYAGLLTRPQMETFTTGLLQASRR